MRVLPSASLPHIESDDFFHGFHDDSLLPFAVTTEELDFHSEKCYLENYSLRHNLDPILLA